jgi:hypothetical protein
MLPCRCSLYLDQMGTAPLGYALRYHKIRCTSSTREPASCNSLFLSTARFQVLVALHRHNRHHSQTNRWAFAHGLLDRIGRCTTPNCPCPTYSPVLNNSAAAILDLVKHTSPNQIPHTPLSATEGQRRMWHCKKTSYPGAIRNRSRLHKLAFVTVPRHYSLCCRHSRMQHGGHLYRFHRCWSIRSNLL